MPIPPAASYISSLSHQWSITSASTLIMDRSFSTVSPRIIGMLDNWLKIALLTSTLKLKKPDEEWLSSPPPCVTQMIYGGQLVPCHFLVPASSVRLSHSLLPGGYRGNTCYFCTCTNIFGKNFCSRWTLCLLPVSSKINLSMSFYFLKIKCCKTWKTFLKSCLPAALVLNPD